MVLNNAIFILGSHKSGTSLVRNLLDGASSIFVLPFETHFFEITGHWIDYPLRYHPPEKLSFDQVMKRIEENIILPQEDDNSLDKYGGGSVPTAKWNQIAFKEHLNKTGKESYLSGNMRGFILAYIEAIYLAINGTLPDSSLRFVEKSVENAEYATYLARLFPDSKFIHVIRNPYAVITSLRKYKVLSNNYPFLSTLISTMEKSYYYACVNPLTIKNYRVLKYEDLLMSPISVMQSLASFLDISFESVMLKPTNLGEEWAGNSTSGQKFTNISTSPILSWEDEISPMEITIINHRFSHIFDLFGYKKLPSNKSVWKRSKNESVSKYIINRLYWITERQNIKHS